MFLTITRERNGRTDVRGSEDDSSDNVTEHDDDDEPIWTEVSDWSG